MNKILATNSIVQIYISDQNNEPPEILNEAITSVKKSFTAHEYTLYDGERLQDFIAQHFPREVVNAYEKLRPYAYKADLGRYCLLYQQGGWYADISILMRQTVGIMDQNIDLVYFSDLGDGVVPERSLFDVSNSLFYARPQHQALELAIQTVLEHCNNEYYGPSIYCPTGPAVLGAAIAIQERSQNQINGHLMALTPNHRFRNHSFVLPDGQILALFKKGWMAPNDVLFGKREGTNNYADLWRQRQVYKQ